MPNKKESRRFKRDSFLLGIPVPCIEIDAVRAACFLQQIMNMKFHSALGNEQIPDRHLTDKGRAPEY